MSPYSDMTRLEIPGPRSIDPRLLGLLGGEAAVSMTFGSHWIVAAFSKYAPGGCKLRFMAVAVR